MANLLSTIVTGGSGTTPTLSLDRNIAAPSNYYNGVQLEIKATSGTAGIGLHRSGFSHVGIYHNAANELRFDMNSGTVVLNHNTGTIWGSGNLTNLNQLTNGPGYITSVGNITRLWAESHPDDYYVRANWTGSYWQLTSNHPSPVQVGYADNAGALSGLGVGSFLRDDGWNTNPGQDANTQEQMRVDFTYSNNAPYTGELIRFGSSGYSTQFNTSYGNSDNFAFRTRNGDNGTWNTWKAVIHSGNIGSQSVDYAVTAGDASTLGGFGRGNTTNKIAYFDGSRNLYVNNPETYTGEVRLGAAWGRGGVYTSGTLSLSTSGTQTHFVFDNSVPIIAYSTGRIDLGGSSTEPINITGANNKYLTINPGNGYEAMVRYIGGSGSGWYVGKRTANQVVGNESFHFFAEAAGQTVAGIDTSGNMVAIGSMRAPIFYDSADTAYYLDPNAGKSLRIAGGIAQNNLVGRPYAVWGRSGGSTGPVVIKFPGDTNNYGMVHAVIDIYEYGSNGVCTIIIGGHNWGSRWYEFNAQVVGFTNKQVRLGVKDGKYCIVIGDSASSWSYGQVVLRKIQNGAYYDNVMDVASGYTIEMETDEYSYITGDLRSFSTPSSLYAGGIVNTPAGYVSNGNPWGTLNSAFFPNGVTTANQTNWLYGHNYIGNAPSNGGGVEISSTGRIYSRVSSVSQDNGYAGRFLDRNSAGTNYIPYSFEEDNGNHSWGQVARFHIFSNSGSDRPSIQFSSGYNNTRWNVGYCYYDDNFRIVQNMGFRPDMSGNTDNWGTERFRINTDGSMYCFSSFTASGDVTAYSDIRVKDNIETIPNAIDKVKSIRGVTFTRTDNNDNKKYMGVIAQELLNVIPEVVSETDSGMYTVAYGNITAVLIEAIKEQQKQIDELKAKLDGLTK